MPLVRRRRIVHEEVPGRHVNVRYVATLDLNFRVWLFRRIPPEHHCELVDVAGIKTAHEALRAYPSARDAERRD
jgi:hypothetical protein